MDPSILPLIDRATRNTHRTAIVDAGVEYSYGDLLDASERIATALLNGERDLQEARVAFLVAPGFEYVATQWGIWRAGGIAVPLGASHPPPELDYVIVDSAADIVVAQARFAEEAGRIAWSRMLRFLTTEDALAWSPGEIPLPDLEISRRAMILYTSGTTNRPKGVVTTHANIQAQVETLVEAWGWSPDDHILLVLPLHHVHGIINVLTCALWSGARCTTHTRFAADAVWEVLVDGGLTLFMAVPTIYNRLISAWDQADEPTRRAMSAGCGRLRLMVSGSAALPVPVLERWLEISGHTLLERYGMTEIGMALSNPLDGERRPGHVGMPLPSVEVRLVDEEGNVLESGEQGEVEVRGPSVFSGYWHRPEVTSSSFRDGWFRTGDVAIVNNGYYRILGRNSIDIIKTGGYKVSALEVEGVLLGHPRIAECAVVGSPDYDLGESVCAVLVLREGPELSQADLRAWASQWLAPYKIPREFYELPELPRNAMGKVIKSAVTDYLGYRWSEKPIELN